MMSDDTHEEKYSKFENEETSNDDRPFRIPRNTSNDENENPQTGKKLDNLWPQIRQLLVFQLKLYIDALRDILMSPFSIVIFAIDLIQGNKGDDALFESLMNFGRKSERAINLFNQHETHNKDFKNIDSIIAQVEESIRQEHRDGTVTSAAKESLEKSLDSLKKKISGTNY